MQQMREKQAAETEANTENAKTNQAITAATTNAEVDEAKLMQKRQLTL